jgi:hypothetical protein
VSHCQLTGLTCVAYYYGAYVCVCVAHCQLTGLTCVAYCQLTGLTCVWHNVMELTGVAAHIYVESGFRHLN